MIHRSSPGKCRKFHPVAIPELGYWVVAARVLARDPILTLATGSKLRRYRGQLDTLCTLAHIVAKHPAPARCADRAGRYSKEDTQAIRRKCTIGNDKNDNRLNCLQQGSIVQPASLDAARQSHRSTRGSRERPGLLAEITRRLFMLCAMGHRAFCVGTV